MSDHPEHHKHDEPEHHKPKHLEHVEHHERHEDHDHHGHHEHKQLISLLVPFRDDSGDRTKVWRWLKKYWRHELKHEAEIVMGHDHGGTPFSKTAAINDAARRAKGDIFVILDADTYIPGSVLTHAADRIRNVRSHGGRLWFVPYRHIYRLTKEATERVLESDPKDPLRFPTPPDIEDVQDTRGSGFGHKFGALVMIFPREAFELVGCMDPRFRGWGGEDISFVLAMDTLYTKHKNLPNDVLHLWHRKIGETYITRRWPGQGQPRENEWLAKRYRRAYNKPAEMRELVDEGCALVPHTLFRICYHWLKHRARKAYRHVRDAAKQAYQYVWNWIFGHDTDGPW